MKNQNLTSISVLALLGFAMMLSEGCKKTNDNPYTVFDIDGNGYQTVTIGTAIWMKENLRTTKYLNGDLIGTTNPATLDISGELTPEYQWAYGGNESNAAVYGRLYTAYAVMDARGICPTGWHVATNDGDWGHFNNYLGGAINLGHILKEKGTAHWQTPNTGAIDSVGFAALPGGSRNYDGTFNGIGSNGVWWSSTPFFQSSAWSETMYYNSNSLDILTADNKFGYSVRCVKN